MIIASQMDEFQQRFKRIDQKRIREYLRSLASPCYESTLLRLAFPELDILKANPLNLYQNHFLLFHLLYQLQNEFYEEDKYLFVHFMRTFLIDYPESGACRFYEERIGRFCNTPCDTDQSYCEFHSQKLGHHDLERLSAKYFYLDSENFYALDEEAAESLMNGTWEILRHYKAYQQSFEILELPQTADIQMIKQKFRRLAKKYHPDRGALSHEKFNEINRAYQLLIRLMPRLTL